MFKILYCDKFTTEVFVFFIPSILTKSWIEVSNVICGSVISVINRIIEKDSAISVNKLRNDVRIRVIINNIQDKFITQSIESEK